MSWGQRAIEGNWPRVQQLFLKKVGPAALTIVNDEKAMRDALKKVHKSLPLPVRLVVRQGTFIRFCTQNKSRLVPAANRLRSRP